MKNQDIYFDFQTNPSLADALAGANPGDKIKIELEVQVTSKDEKGLSGVIEPNSIVPEGYEQEEPTGDNDPADITPPAPPPGAVTQSMVAEPVTQAMALRKKKGK